ncbi:hypothetical protein BST81_09915 [Leptolyngbya sp. 'hensonii']|uniref:hypothetical protein n=1 Tax=Leptolyngbya sp. 'hensonii' TaxID=1922337 RepID=UPI00094F835B|nr:hypothetical protein [Leptolyngbya sp. 'hensonii']OLP18596.1 hypothetical protein BST81_09915 [Leptolyngbya sp. 'hensonii']
MTPAEIDLILKDQYSPHVQSIESGLWQIETDRYRLLVLLSEDLSWLRVLIPIAPADAAAPFLEQLLEANFDLTQETRYALSQGVLWGVYHHHRESLKPEDLRAAMKRLLLIHEQGLSSSFNQFVESRIRLIIQAAKQQGQSLEETLQQLNHFYEEGLMGEMEGGQAKEEVLASWRYQLERLWPTVNP